MVSESAFTLITGFVGEQQLNPVIHELLQEKGEDFELAAAAEDIEGLTKEFAFCNDPGKAYVTSNEFCARKVRQVLLKNQLTSKEKRCHIGVASWENFNTAWIRGSKFVVLLDVDKSTIEFNKLTIQALKVAETRKQFAQCMIEACGNVRENMKYDQLNLSPFEESNAISEHLAVEFRNRGSFLYKDISYAFIRRLALKGRIAVVRGNLYNLRWDGKDGAHDMFVKIYGIVSSVDLTVDTLNISNVQDYASYKDITKSKFMLEKNIRVLLDAYTIVIGSTITKFPLAPCAIKDIMDWADFVNDPMAKRKYYSSGVLKRFALENNGSFHFEPLAVPSLTASLQPHEEDRADFVPAS